MSSCFHLFLFRRTQDQLHKPHCNFPPNAGTIEVHVAIVLLAKDSKSEALHTFRYVDTSVLNEEVELGAYNYANEGTAHTEPPFTARFSRSKGCGSPTCECRLPRQWQPRDNAQTSNMGIVQPGTISCDRTGNG